MLGNSEHSAFAQGRQEAAKLIRTKLSDLQEKTAHHAKVSVEDLIPFGQGSPLGGALKKAVEHLLLEQCTHLNKALEALESGESVYSLTGHESIPTYKRITGGDFFAGVLSMTDDFAVMVMSMDTSYLSNEAAQEFKKNFNVKETKSSSELKEETSLAEIIQNSMSFATAIRSDFVLSYLEEKIKNSIGARGELEFEDGSIEQKTFSRRLSRIWAQIEHHGSRNARRSAKIPSSWPPLKQGPDADIDFNDAPIYEEEVSQEFTFEKNTDKEFYKGFMQGLKDSYAAIQDVHFDMIHSQKYASTIGLSASWEKTVCDCAQNMLPDIRTIIRDQIEKDAYGEGNSFELGHNSAIYWIQNELATSEYLNGEDRHQVYVFEHLSSYWSSSLKRLIGAHNQANDLGGAPTPKFE